MSTDPQALEQNRILAETEKFNAEAVRARRSPFAEPAFWTAAAALLVAIVGYVQAVHLDDRAAARDVTQRSLDDAKRQLDEVRSLHEKAQLDLKRVRDEEQKAQVKVNELADAKVLAELLAITSKQQLEIQDRRFKLVSETAAATRECLATLQRDLSRIADRTEPNTRQIVLDALERNDDYIKKNFLDRSLDRADVGKLAGFVAAQALVPYLRDRLRGVTESCEPSRGRRL